MEGKELSVKVVNVSLDELRQMIHEEVSSVMESWLDKKIKQEREDKANEETMLTINEVVSKYKVCRSTVYNKTKSGEIPCSRIGSRVLIRKTDIEKALKTGGISQN